jgi:hypothetical protein
MSETTSNVEMAYKISENGNREARHGSRVSEAIEIIEAVVLAVVAVATAWSGYQSALWNGQQVEFYGESSKLRITADADATLAGQQRLHDSMMFNAWIQARSSENDKLTRLFEARFRDEFRVAFDAWMKLDPLNTPRGPPSPIFMPEYKNKLADQATSQNEQAIAMFDKGTRARHRADAYVRITVYLATVLLVTAIGQRFHFRVVRVGTLAAAIVLLAIGLYFVFTLPKI